ncbi:MAG: hypothetical protein II798_00325 [Lachnospiraceae bacterium]|nr:hypothetical protein [Lachnospiraceae bacterium]
MLSKYFTKSFRKSVMALGLAAVMALTPVSTARAAVLGIDVSKYNGGIDWGSVAASGVSYTFIKVGSTKSGVDPRFAENITNAQACGVRTGVYIYSYAHSVEEAINEANLVLQWIEPYNVNFPIAFDIEDRSQAGIDPNTFTEMCNQFCDVIASAGYTPIVYTYRNFFRAHVTPNLRYDYWIAQYAGACDVPGHAIWQYSSNGSVAGVPSRVDMNWMNKDYAGLILPVGFAKRGEFTYFYNNYRLQRGWVDYSGLRFHMDDAFHMNTGWFADEAGTYYLSPEDGHAYVGLQQIDKDRYYFDEAYHVRNGLITVGDFQYYFDGANGCKMHTGWLGLEDGVRYFDPTSGAMLVGLNAIDKNAYLFNEKGLMQTAWQTINGQKFYFNPADGKMVHGFLGDLPNRYYLDPTDGHMVTGYATIEKNNYFFNNDGLMQVGFVKIGDQTYYFDPATGAQKTGFIGDGTNVYYFTPAGGQLVTGVQVIDGATYYFDATGKMQVGFQVINGLTFYFDPATGKLVTNTLLPTEAGTVYTAPDGHMVVNQAVVINKVPCVFDEKGHMVINRNYVIGNITYVCNEAGVAVAVDPNGQIVPIQ